MEALLQAIGRHLFLVFGLMAVGGAAFMVFSRHIVRGVIAFLFTMLSIAGCYLCLQAEFLALAQILVYAGGIIVLFLFVVMLVEMGRYREGSLFQRQAPFSVLVVLAALGGLLLVSRKLLLGPSAERALSLPADVAKGLDVSAHNAQAISRGLYAGHLLPFEVLSVILLVALVGAVVLAKARRN